MNGDHIKEIFNQYSATLYKISSVMLANAADASDAVQETFLKYMISSKKFQTDEHEKAWLIRVNINICKNMLRFHKTHPVVSYENLTIMPHSAEENRTMDVLMSLRSKDKEVLILYYIEGYSCREIGKLLKISENAVKKRLERARNNFKNQMRRYNNMIFDSISSLANDIQIDKKKCGEIYTQCCIEFQKRVRKQKVRRRCSVSFLAVLLIVGMCVIMTNINHTVVYATGQEGRVQLKEGVKVQLQEEKTPLGRGYSFEISLGNGQRYKVIEGEENQNAQNIFQNGNTIYWIPDGIFPSKIKSEEGTEIQIGETDKSTLQIRVYKGEGYKDIQSSAA